jgi:preprotein translocase subunit SecD
MPKPCWICLVLVALALAGCDSAEDRQRADADRESRPPADPADSHILRFELQADPGWGEKPNVDAIQVLKQRIDPDRLGDLEFIPIGKTQIEIRMPKDPARSGDPQEMVRLVQSLGVLEFRVAPRVPEVVVQDQRLISRRQVQRYIEQFRQQGPDAGDETDDFLWLPIRGQAEDFANLIITEDDQGAPYILLSNQTGQTMLRRTDTEASWRLKKASVGRDSLGAPAVDFQLDPHGAHRFAALTSGNIGRSLAIVVDGEVYSAPNIRTTVQNRGQITGRFSVQQVGKLVGTLNAGAHPARILIGPTETIDPPDGAPPQAQ